MYYVKKIVVDEAQCYTSSRIIDVASGTHEMGLELLESRVKSFVKKQYGKSADNMDIIDIHNLEQINIPLVDCVLAYRLAEDKSRIRIYQKKTTVTQSKGIIWTTDVTSSTFRLTHFFELERSKPRCILKQDRTNCLAQKKIDTVENIDMVKAGPANVKIPKKYIVSPMTELFNELKERFANQKTSDGITSVVYKTKVTRQKHGSLESKKLLVTSCSDIQIEGTSVGNEDIYKPMIKSQCVPKPPPPMLMPRSSGRTQIKLDEIKLDNGESKECGKSMELDEIVDDNKASEIQITINIPQCDNDMPALESSDNTIEINDMDMVD